MSKPSAAVLRSLYIDNGLSTRTIGAKYGVAHITVRRWLANEAIPIRLAGSGLAHRGMPQPSREELERMIYAERLTYREIAERYDVDHSAIPYWLDRHGISRPSRTRIGVDDVRLRYERGDSAAVIADELGCSKTSVLNFLRRAGIARRRTGWRAPYTATDGTVVKSSYEARVASWLTRHDVAYEYEPRVPFGHCNTRADFLANGWFIEVWGVQKSPRYTIRRATKIEAYRAAGIPLIQLSSHHFATRYKHVLERRLRTCLLEPV